MLGKSHSIAYTHPIGQWCAAYGTSPFLLVVIHDPSQGRGFKTYAYCGHKVKVLWQSSNANSRSFSRCTSLLYLAFRLFSRGCMLLGWSGQQLELQWHIGEWWGHSPRPVCVLQWHSSGSSRTQRPRCSIQPILRPQWASWWPFEVTINSDQPTGVAATLTVH